MRIYQNFQEALSEIKRDLAEMGIKTHSRTYQDKNVEDDPEFTTLELNNYVYTVSHPKLSNLKATQPWANAEFSERVSGESMNPGQAFTRRPEVWLQFLNKMGRFDYTYSERLDLYSQIEHVVEGLKKDSDSRQLYITIWQPLDVTKIGAEIRIPCSLGYYFKMVQGKLDMTYLQRSADFVTHLENDIYLAFYLQNHIAIIADVLPGNFTHWIGSLHVFKKDIGGVF